MPRASEIRLEDKTRKQVLAEFRNAEILGAARRVFAAQGFEGASVQDIAHLAGVAKGTVYLYYPSKGAIYREALRSGLVDLMDELRKRIEEAPSVRQKIRAFIETKIAYFEEHRDFFRIYSAAFGDLTHPPQCEKDCKSLYFRQLALLKWALRAPSKGERIRIARPEAAAFAVFDLTRGAITRRLFGRSCKETEKDAAFLLELIWKGLGGR